MRTYHGLIISDYERFFQNISHSKLFSLHVNPIRLGSDTDNNMYDSFKILVSIYMGTGSIIKFSATYATDYGHIIVSQIILSMIVRQINSTNLRRLNDCARSLAATCFGLDMVICLACNLTNSNLTIFIKNTRLANIDKHTGPDSIHEYKDSCIQQLKKNEHFLLFNDINCLCMYI